MEARNSDGFEGLPDSTNIVDTARIYMSLEQRGSGYAACCPFHDDTARAFLIHPERGFFHCFGCGESGDVIALVMKCDQVSFEQAKWILARRAGSSGPRQY